MEISISDKGIFYPYLKEIGYCGLDVSFGSFDKKEWILSEEYTNHIRQKFQSITDAGLMVCQTHLTYYPGHIPPLGNGSYQDFEEYMLPMLIKEIELTALMHCGVTVLHPYFEKDKAATRQGNIQLLSKLLPFAKKHKVILAIENIFAFNHNDAHLSTPEDWMFYIDHFQSPYLGICLDTGHAVILKQNPVALFRELKDHIVALHLHTATANIDMHAVPYTTSYGEQIDWDALYQEIMTSPYSGTFNLELGPSSKVSDAAKKAYYLFAYETAKTIIDSAHRKNPLFG